MDVILKKYFWVVNLVVIAICASLAGRAAAGMIVSAVLVGDGPAAPVRGGPGVFQSPVPGPSRKDGEAILSRNVFCSACQPIKPTQEQAQEGPVDTNAQKS